MFWLETFATFFTAFLVFGIIPLFWSISKRVFQESRVKRYTANIIVWATSLCFILFVHAFISIQGL